MVLRRVGLLGGTFDPVHHGHIEVALQARAKAGLERVIFIPAGHPRLKSNEPSASPVQRLEMLSLAVGGVEGFEISDVEVHREGPTKTVETLRELRSGLEADEELVFILGMDVLRRFDEWVKPERVVELASILAVNRPGYMDFDWDRFYGENPYAEGRVECLDTTAIDVSASVLRGRLAGGESVAGLVPAAVMDYIREKGLYKV